MSGLFDPPPLIGEGKLKFLAEREFFYGVHGPLTQLIWNGNLLHDMPHAVANAEIGVGNHSTGSLHVPGSVKLLPHLCYPTILALGNPKAQICISDTMR